MVGQRSPKLTTHCTPLVLWMARSDCFRSNFANRYPGKSASVAQEGPRWVARLKRILGKKTSMALKLRRWAAAICSCLGCDLTQYHSLSGFLTGSISILITKNPEQSPCRCSHLFQKTVLLDAPVSSRLARFRLAYPIHHLFKEKQRLQLQTLFCLKNTNQNESGTIRFALHETGQTSNPEAHQCHRGRFRSRCWRIGGSAN